MKTTSTLASVLVVLSTSMAMADNPLSSAVGRKVWNKRPAYACEWPNDVATYGAIQSNGSQEALKALGCAPVAANTTVTVLDTLDTGETKVLFNLNDGKTLKAWVLWTYFWTDELAKERGWLKN